MSGGGMFSRTRPRSPRLWCSVIAVNDCPEL
jgi:hypothetical protein